MELGVHSFNLGAIPEWSIFNPGALRVQITPISDSDTNHNSNAYLPNFGNSGGIDDNSEFQSSLFNIESKASAILTVTPTRKYRYQLIIICREENGSKEKAVTIEVQVLSARRKPMPTAKPTLNGFIFSDSV